MHLDEKEPTRIESESNTNNLVGRHDIGHFLPGKKYQQLTWMQRNNIMTHLTGKKDQAFTTTWNYLPIQNKDDARFGNIGRNEKNSDNSDGIPQSYLVGESFTTMQWRTMGDRVLPLKIYLFFCILFYLVKKKFF